MPDLGTIVIGNVASPSGPTGPTGPTGPAVSPAGATGAVQYNNGGVLGGIAGFTGSIVIPGGVTLTVVSGVITAAA